MMQSKVDPRDLGRALCAEVEANRVHIDDLTLAVYSRSADFYEYRPQAVVKARTEAEVQGVLRVANEHKVPVTFRAAGTSLSGQVLGTGIICDISGGFQKIEPRDNGKLVFFQPGPVLTTVDRVLEPHNRRIGPDPASSTAARMGGVIANNASGMTAGVKFNSYHTLHSMRVVLVDGSVYDSGVEGDYSRFENEQQALAQGLLELRNEILADADLVEKINKKFSIKCVTGYGINAFVDFERPLDIFVHLMVGSEGTLGFASEVVLKTLPLSPVRSTSMLLFKDISTCAAAVPVIEAMDAQALELMNDGTLKAYHETPGMPDFVYTRPAGACALLIDFWRESQEEIQDVWKDVEPKIRQCAGLLDMSPFTKRPEEHHTLWDARSQLFGLLGRLRPPGSVVLTEDMAVPLDELVPFVQGLEMLYAKHGYDQCVIAGHASAGNLHFWLIDDLSKPEGIDRFKNFMEDAVRLVADELNGSLKAEHGTGRVVAPFVEREWGAKAYGIMKRLKTLADPEGLMNPDVIITDKSEEFYQNIKLTPDVWYGIDKCVECGFCEHVCPSRMAALTPRGRIQASRKHTELVNDGHHHDADRLWKDYQYAGVQMCAADGMCHTQCPVGINTGLWTDYLRGQNATAAEKGLATWVAKNFATVEHVLRGTMDLGSLTNKVGHSLEHLTQAFHHLVPFAPVWVNAMTKAPPEIHNEIDEPDFVYYATCVSRMMGSSAAGKKSVAETVLEIGRRAGFKMLLAKDTRGTCCGQIWEHKGFEAGFAYMANLIVQRMWKWSAQGRVPIVVDVSTCNLTLTQDLPRVLTDENARRYQKLHLLDINEWLQVDVLPKLKVSSKLKSVVLHPTCGCVQTGSQAAMLEVAKACADEATIPIHWNCCGTAGDRGFYHPELTDGAQLYEQQEVAQKDYDGYYSVAKTCEINLSQRSGKNYESIAYLVEEATRP
jgi:D-lactate dehydrogenase